MRYKSLSCAIAMSVGVLAAPPSLADLVHQWTFNDGTANDSVGTANGTLFHGATLSDGQLVLDGINDYVQTSKIDKTISTKTLMVWATLDNLTQRSGGLLTIEHSVIDKFDSIVYGERVPNQWMAGSSGFQRSIEDNGGASETELGEVFIAIVYKADNSIEIYRNGQPYSRPYRQGSLQTYDATTTHILFGVRHHHRIGEGGTAPGKDAYFAGKINEARVYDTALSSSEIQAIFSAGPVSDKPTGCEHASYDLKKKTLTVPFVEFPVVNFLSGQATGEVELWTGALKQIYGTTNRFRLLNNTVKRVTDGSRCPATYALKTGTLSIPYVDVPTGIAVGGKKFEGEVNVFKVILTWEPMGRNFMVQEVEKRP